MEVLVLNCGTDSLRFKLIDTVKNQTILKGEFEKLSLSSAEFSYKNLYKDISYTKTFSGSLEDAVQKILSVIVSPEGHYRNINKLDAIGHRVVHGGNIFSKPILITNDIITDIANLSKFAPLHNGKTAKVMEICLKEIHKKRNNVGVFDTSFHNTIPEINSKYPIPNELYEKANIRKYGFHGISYQNTLDKLSKVLGKDKKDINAVMSHLGSGASMCLIKNGKSHDVSMGLTPLDGLMMSTRSGSIDPGIIPFICEYYKCDVNQAVKILNENSGYYGICGEKDIKTVCDLSEKGNEKMQEAREMANISFKKNLGGMLAQTKKIDALVVTGGMGSKNDRQRELFLSNLDQFGIDIDKKKNKQPVNDHLDISSKKSKTKVLVIPSNEEAEIAKQTSKLLNKGRGGK